MSNYMPNIEDIYRDRTLYIKEMEAYLENLKKGEKYIMNKEKWKELGYTDEQKTFNITKYYW